MAQRATSLGPKPSLFIYFFVFFGLLLFLSFLCFVIQKNCFPPRKGHFCLFLSVSLCFSLAFLGLPLFQFLFLCLSLFFFSVFFPSCFFFVFFWFLVFVSFFFVSFFFAFLSSKEQHQNIQLQVFFINIFFWFPVFVFLSSPFFLILFFC